MILYNEFSGVTTEQIWLTTSEGVKLKAKVYKSESASEIMPGIVVCHGLMASHQTMQSRFSLEFAKRNFLVVAIDLSGHGDSGGSISIDETNEDVQSFDDDDYVEVANDTSLDVQNEFTLSAWIEAGGGVDQVILTKEDIVELHQDRNFKLSLLDNGFLSLRFSSTSNVLDGNVTDDTDLRNVGWRNVVGVYNGTHCYLYLNGEFQASDPTSDAPEGIGGNLWIGRGNYAGSQREFNGTIDEVRISNIARSAAWIKASYESENDHLLDFGSEESEGDAGWLSGWNKRVKITIDHNDIDSALSNFPLLIYLSNSSRYYNDDVSHVFDELERNDNRKKIAITTSDEVTQCYVEIEKWDNGTEKAWLWVKVPSLSDTSDTDLYLYYDSSQSDNTDYVGDSNSTPAENVWDNNFKLVTHMEGEAHTSLLRDSTSNNNDGTKKFEPDEVVGKIGKAQHFTVESLLQRGIINIGNEINHAVRTSVDYLLSRSDVNQSKIAVLGHSMGGAAVFREGYSDHRVKSVVSIAPGSWIRMNSTSPQNLLLVVGGRDKIVSKTSVLNLLRLTTGGGEEIDKLYGDFSEGNARKMIVSPGTDHAGEMFDPKIVEETIAWVEASLGIDSTLPVSISPWPKIFFPLSVTAALFSIFPVILCVKEVGRLINKGKTSQVPRSTHMGIKKLLITYLVAWSYGAVGTLLNLSTTFLTPITPSFFGGFVAKNLAIFGWIPVIFANSLLIAYLIVSVILLLGIIVFYFVLTKEKLRLYLELKTSTVLGVLGFLVMFSALNLVFTQNFIDLFPTTREFSLMMILFAIFLPLTLLDEFWLRNLQNRLSNKSWQKIGIPFALYLLPKVIPLGFASFVFGNLVLIALPILFIPALFTAWLFDESKSIAGGVVFNALFFAWTIAVVLPFGG